MRWTSRIAISLMLLTVAGVARAGSEDEVKALFAKFVAAQNARHLGSRCSTQALRGAISGHLVSRLQDRGTQGNRVAARRRAALRADNVHDLPSRPDCAANALPNEPSGGEDCRRLEGIEHPPDPSTAAIGDITFRIGS